MSTASSANASFVIHYRMGCRLVSAINEDTNDFNSLLKSAYEFDRGMEYIISGDARIMRRIILMN
ncbi:MAG: hypothetical protein J7J65_03190 [Candidatus Korarchaeota archaeon]|nr:hypothetical protein [Candidatus Korarchaeota archaeon]